MSIADASADVKRVRKLSRLAPPAQSKHLPSLQQHLLQHSMSLSAVDLPEHSTPYRELSVDRPVTAKHPSQPALHPITAMATFEQRLKTFTNWPHRKNHAPEYMAAAGFLQNHQVQGHNDAAMCFNCDTTLASWDSAMDPVKEHLVRSPRCTWITSKMMNTQEKREETFDDWPFNEQLSYMMVAAAGFFQSDIPTHTVTCYSCQLTLGPQQLGTDPLRAHIRLDNRTSPCTYLSKATSPAECARPPTPPPTPPLLRHRCPECHNLFSTLAGLRRHLADPKKAHLPKPRKIIGRRTAPIRMGGKVTRPRMPGLAGRITAPNGMRRGVARRRVPDLARRITRPPSKPEPEYIKIEDDD